MSISLRSKEISLLVLLLCGCPAHTESATNTDDSDKRYLLGADLYGKHMIPQATEELLKAVQLNPNNADAHYLLGLIYMGKGVEGLELATRNQCLRGGALALDKKDVDAEMTKAEKEFNEAIRNRVDFSDAWNSLAVVAQHFGRFDDALAAAGKALGNIIYREPWAAHLNLGIAYISKGDYVRAAQSLRKALFDNPKLCVGHWRLAQVYKELGETDHAREELDLLFADKACGSLQEAYHLGGVVALKLGDRARAQELLRQCVNLAPKSCLARECGLALPPGSSGVVP